MEKLKIIYRDTSIIGAHKPSGIATYQESRNQNALGLKELLEEQLSERLFPVHRIDADTSGLVLFALNSRAAAGMIRLFKEQQVDKYYMAWCVGEVPKEGSVTKGLKKNKSEQVESARTDYERVKLMRVKDQTAPGVSVKGIVANQGKVFSLVHLFPFTGRFHQIRRHFEMIGHPLVGDPLYGRAEDWTSFFPVGDQPRLMLLAESVEFVHPITHRPIRIKTKVDF